MKRLVIGLGLLVSSWAVAETRWPEGVRNVRWQTLPNNVRSVSVGPDGRIWQMFTETVGTPAGTNVPKDEIAGEFKAATPRLRDVKPILFEPGGRVWFQPRSTRLVVGYDGANWIEQPAAKGGWFTGGNLIVAGVAFFPDRNGVHTFDGKVWAFQAVQSDGSGPAIVMEQDSQGVLAFTRAVPFANRRQPAELWRWRNGAWTRVDLSEAGKDLVDVAPVGRDADAQVLLFTRAGKVQPMRLGKQSTVAIDEMVKNLGDASFAKREAATRELTRLGTAYRPALEEALRKMTDPEIQGRLEQVLKELQETPSAMSSKVMVAGYEVTGAQLRHYSTGGTLYLAGESITGRDGKSGPGLLIVPATGAARVLWGEEFRQPWKSSNSRTVFAEPDRRVWVMGDAPRLLDLEQGRFIDKLPVTGYRQLLAGLSDGSLFVQVGEGVGLYRPGAPDDREFLPAEKFVLNGGACVVTPDGQAWAEIDEKGLSRYDGKTWTRVEGLEGSQRMLTAVAGLHNEVLARFADRSFLITETNVWPADRIDDLIKEHRETFAKAWPAGWSGKNLSGNPLALALDAAGNFWFRDERSLRVLAGDQWLSAEDHFKAAEDGMIRRPEIVLPMGGRRVYITAGRTKAVYGEVRDSELLFTPAPICADAMPLRRTGLDGFGTLWISGEDTESMGRNSWRTFGQWIRRVNEDGVVNEFKNEGWPYLFDRAGNAWLGHLWTQPVDKFRVWNENFPAYELSLPGANYGSPMVAASASTVYASTPVGLWELSVPAGKEPNRFETRRFYYVDGLEGSIQSLFYSPRGFLAMQTTVWRDDKMPLQLLYIIRLLKPPMK